MRGRSLLSRLLGRDLRPPDAADVPQNLLTVAVTARLNVRAIPEDRSYYYGDPLDRVLAAKSLGEVTDGGTMFDTDTGRIDYIDLEIGLQDSSDQTFSTIVDALEELGAPKGSFLDILAENRKIPFGRFDGLSLSLRKAALANPDDVSEEVNQLLSALEEALGDRGAFRGFWEGPDACELYFYGPDFDAMRVKIHDFSAIRPELTGCAITQIA